MMALDAKDKAIKSLLEKKFKQYYNQNFIASDPLSLPHRFVLLQDIEIIAFWVAMISWGNRKSIIKSGEHLIQLMDHRPYDFVLNHSSKDLRGFEKFVHRTFQPTDALGFISFLKRHYSIYDSLELAFLTEGNFFDMKSSLLNFHNYFFTDTESIAPRTKKHIASPLKSTCKRLNMFLRWMVRDDSAEIDFGLWQTIKPSGLMMPLDVHVERASRSLGLITNKKCDWQAVEQLTARLRLYDAHDPVKYDFALFGLGMELGKGLQLG